jgi:uroporphyrinogen-III synthase
MQVWSLNKPPGQIFLKCSVMRLIVTRPEPDAITMISRLEALGHSGILSPLLSIQPVPNAAIPNQAWQAVLATSANGVRALARSPVLRQLRNVPLLAVGEASTHAAEGCGFLNVRSANGDLSDLVALAVSALTPGKGPLLYLSGSVTSGDLKGELEAADFTVFRAVMYEAVAAAVLPSAAVAALTASAADGVVLFSRRSSEIWIELLGDAGLITEAAKLAHYCLSPGVASAIAKTWPANAVSPAVSIAPHMDIDGFLQSLT